MDTQQVIANTVIVSRRPKPQWHEGRPTWDVMGVTADGTKRNGLVYEADLHAFLPTVGDPVPVKWWTGDRVIPGTVEWVWGSGIEIAADGTASLVDWRDVPANRPWTGWDDPRIVPLVFVYTLRPYKAKTGDTE